MFYWVEIQFFDLVLEISGQNMHLLAQLVRGRHTPLQTRTGDVDSQALDHLPNFAWFALLDGNLYCAGAAASIRMHLDV